MKATWLKALTSTLFLGAKTISSSFSLMSMTKTAARSSSLTSAVLKNWMKSSAENLTALLFISSKEKISKIDL